MSSKTVVISQFVCVIIALGFGITQFCFLITDIQCGIRDCLIAVGSTQILASIHVGAAAVIIWQKWGAYFTSDDAMSVFMAAALYGYLAYAVTIILIPAGLITYAYCIPSGIRILYILNGYILMGAAGISGTLLVCRNLQNRNSQTYPQHV